MFICFIQHIYGDNPLPIWRGSDNVKCAYLESCYIVYNSGQNIWVGYVPKVRFGSFYIQWNFFLFSSDQQGSGMATAGVFTYFFWVLLQPFRGNPEYRDVADLPYNGTCLETINAKSTNHDTLSKYRLYRLRLYHNQKHNSLAT